MSYNVTISHHDVVDGFKKDIHKDQTLYNELVQYATNKSQSLISRVFIPTRVDTLGHLITNVFLPCTAAIRTYQKINNVVTPLFDTVLLFIFDVIGLPIRLITLLPRCLSYASSPRKTNLQMYKFLEEFGVPTALLNKEYVQIKVEWKDGKGRGERIWNAHFYESPDYACVSNAYAFVR